MNKIPTIFERDWDADRSRVLNVPHADCSWVFDGEGMATRKYDGTAAMIDADRDLYKRLALPEGNLKPDGFIELAWEGEEGKRKLIGWAPVTDGPEDQWLRQAWENLCAEADIHMGPRPGTYELLGPKIQKNPECFPVHTLVPHAEAVEYPNAPTTFEDLRVWLVGLDIEGLVWHHPDGRMAKIKKRDFGLRRED